MKTQNKLEQVQETKLTDLQKGSYSFLPLMLIPLVVALTLISVSVVAIATDYRGMIDLKFGPDGGYLKINR